MIIHSLRRSGIAAVLMGAVVFGWAAVGVADDDTATVASKQEATSSAQEETLDAIKRRALQIIQEHQARQLQFYGEVSAGAGYEKNPLYGSARKGDGFTEESLFLLWSKQLTRTITWQGSYIGDYTGYPHLTDASLTFSSLTPAKLLWQLNPMWRAEGGVDLGYVWFPKDGNSGYREFKPNVGIRQNLWGSWFHTLRFDSSLRRYIAAHARDDAGNPKPAHRRDIRPRIRYEVGTTWLKTMLRVRNEWYWNDSNDQQQDFYDARDYKLTASLTRPITQKLSLSASYSYELKHYLHRAVSQVSPDRARHDDIDTWNLAATYDLTPTWSVSPSFTYTRDRSNEPTGEYFDWTTALALTAHF